MIERFTVGELKRLLKKYNVPDDALVTCLSDEEGNSESVVCQMYIDIVGDEHKEDIYSWIAGKEAQGIDLEKDKGKVFITFRPLY